MVSVKAAQNLSLPSIKLVWGRGVGVRGGANEGFSVGGTSSSTSLSVRLSLSPVAFDSVHAPL